MKNAYRSLMVILFIWALCCPSFAFVLNTADTIGQGKIGIATIYSANTINTIVPGILFGSDISLALTNHAFGIVGQYGVLPNLDVMLGLGTISYTIAPDAPDLLWKLSGGTLLGLSLKYNIVKEGTDFPVSVAALVQYITLPIDVASVLPSPAENNGYDYDTYYKLIFSKKIGSFIPYMAMGYDQRLLKIGDSSSTSCISQVDLGYGTAVSDKIFLGAEVNWSGRWHDGVMDDLAGGFETMSTAFGWSFGVEYIL